MATRCWVSVGVIAVAAWAWAQEGPAGEWSVADLRPGMKGEGLTVVRGVDPEPFQVEVLGVLRNVQPGRDMVVARLSGLELDKTGVMAGMSGSPVTIDGRLLGAVAYTWEFGLEPIGGITPIAQMRQFSERTLANDSGGHTFAAPDEAVVESTPWGRGRLVPIQTPLAVTGMTDAARAHLARAVAPWGLVPVQSGSANPDVEEANRNRSLVPGSAMGVALVLGDVSVTAIGTVTAVADGKVDGFGHPFMDLGKCELPLLGAYVHTVMPLQTASFKIGSILGARGAILTDVSTGVRGELGREVQMIPLVIHVGPEGEESARTYQCRVARVPALLHSLTASTVSSCLEGTGKAPEQLSVRWRSKIDVEGLEPIEHSDFLSGEMFQGPAGMVTLVGPLSNALAELTSNEFASLEVKQIECWADVSTVRHSARIERAETRRPEYLPGETIEVEVELTPYRSESVGGDSTVRQVLRLALPKNAPPGDYSLMIGSGADDFESRLRHRTGLARPRSIRELEQSIRQRFDARRSDLWARLETKDVGLAIGATEFPKLPGAFVEIVSDKEDRVDRVPGSIATFEKTPWCLEGTQTLTVHVVTKRETLPASPAGAGIGAGIGGGTP